MDDQDTDRLLHEIHENGIQQFGEANYNEALERARLKREFAQLLRTQRKAIKLDQRDLAKTMNITQQQLSNYEKGTTIPSLDRMAELLKAVGLVIIIQNKEGKELVRV